MKQADRASVFSTNLHSHDIFFDKRATTTITTFQVGSSGQLSQISQAVQGGLNMAGLTASGYTDLGAIR